MKCSNGLGFCVPINLVSEGSIKILAQRVTNFVPKLVLPINIFSTFFFIAEKQVNTYLLHSVVTNGSKIRAVMVLSYDKTGLKFSLDYFLGTCYFNLRNPCRKKGVIMC